MINGLEFYNPNNLSADELLNELQFNVVDQTMRRELIDDSNE